MHCQHGCMTSDALECIHQKVTRLEREIAELKKTKDGAYGERNKLVCALSKCFPAWLERHPDSDTEWEDDWRWIVYVDAGTGQMSWHIHDSQLGWFGHLAEPLPGEDTWDGHTVKVKYKRLSDISESRAAREAE